MHKLVSWKKYLLRNEKKTLYMLTALLGTIVLLGVSVALLCIYYSKPIGDDFGAIEYYSTDWLSQAWASLSTTGRYGQSITAAIAYGLFGNHVSVFLSAIIFLWIVLLVFVYMRATAQHFNLKLHYMSLMGISLALSFFLLFVNKAIDNGNPPTWFSYQLFFWPSGIVTYTVPLLALLTGVYLLFIRKNKLSPKKQLAFFGVVIYATSLFNEIQPATLFAFSVAALTLSSIPHFPVLKRLRVASLLTMGTTFMALLTLFFSPGSQNRQTSLSIQVSHDNLIQNVLQNLTNALSNVYFRPRDLLLITVTGLLIAFLITASKKIRVKHLLAVGAAGLLLWIISMVCSLVLIGYGYGDTTGLYARTLLIPQVLYVVTTLIISISIGVALTRTKIRYAATAASLVLCIGILSFTPRYLQQITSQLSSSINYSNAWTYEDQRLKDLAAKNPNETVYLPASVAGIGDGFSLRCDGPYSGSTIWLNDLIEEYYELREICSTQDKPTN